MLSGTSFRSMAGYSVANEAYGMIFVQTFPWRFKRPITGTFPPAAKIRFIAFNLAIGNHIGFLFEVVNADLTQVVKIVGRGIAVNAKQGGRVTGRRAGHKMLQ